MPRQMPSNHRTRPLTALELHKLARSAATRGERVRANAYRLSEDVEDYDANLPAITRLLDESAKLGVEEWEALRQLNGRLRAGGAEPLQLRVVGGFIYKVVTEGNPAVCRGPECPADEVESDREALAERQREYAASR